MVREFVWGVGGRVLGWGRQKKGARISVVAQECVDLERAEKGSCYVLMDSLFTGTTKFIGNKMNNYYPGEGGFFALFFSAVDGLRDKEDVGAAPRTQR